ncbi:proline dehydrogenase family protein [candidate division KSB1 bacterium]
MFSNVLRGVMLSVARSRGIRRVFEKYGLRETGGFARRFIAGSSLEDAVNSIKELNKKGMTATLDLLGEDTNNLEDAENSSAKYLEILDAIEKEKLDSNVSLKLTQMGLDIGEKACQDVVEKIIKKAAEYNNFVRIDMEDSDHTDVTLRIFFNLREKYDNVGIVIQSYLYRSEADIDKINKSKSRVRICKGAYKEPKTVAYPSKKDVDNNFLLITKKLLTEGIYPGVATHDEKMVEGAIKLAQDNSINKKDFEFQMLYGIRRDLQEKLITDGYNVRIYVPFGTEWFPYFSRRLAERPANVFFIMKNFFRG